MADSHTDKNAFPEDISIEERNSLLDLFALLIEADKDLMKAHESRNHGNPNNSD